MRISIRSEEPDQNSIRMWLDIGKWRTKSIPCSFIFNAIKLNSPMWLRTYISKIELQTIYMIGFSMKNELEHSRNIDGTLVK